MEQTMRPFSLPTLTCKKVETLRRKEKDARIHQRLSALLWLDKGYSEDEVADLLDVCSRTVKNWLVLSRAGELESLCSLDYQGDHGCSADPTSTISSERSPPDASGPPPQCAIGSRRPPVEGTPSAACANCSTGWPFIRTLLSGRLLQHEFEPQIFCRNRTGSSGAKREGVLTPFPAPTRLSL
jgi:hypothetical protein